MPNHYTVGKGYEFNYPADAVSEKLIKEFGGRSRMTPAQHAQVKYKTVREGQNCDDMPKGILSLYVSRGWVIEKVEPVPETTWKDFGQPIEGKEVI